MKTIRTQIADGVYLNYLPTRKFKTGLLSAQFVTPLRKETASAYALLPAVLRRGTVRYPDMGLLSAELDRLYGAQISYTVRKKGESQCVGFVASFIDESFVPGGERLLEPVASLLGELICEPVTRSGRFLSAYVEGERENLVDAIRGIRNDKRDYADLRLLQEMCSGERYGISRFGDEQSARKLSVAKLYAGYTELISSARLELFYCGSAALERVEQALLEALSALPREQVQEIFPPEKHPARKAPREVAEALDVTQGKLGMGFSCGSDDSTGLLLGNTIFGGSSNSKLFLNVREKLSLCYYASSVYHRSKGLITVSSGIEFENVEQARDEILTQLRMVQEGQLEDWELEGARSTLLNSYATMGDSQARLENYYLGQLATASEQTPEEQVAELQAATLEQVLAAMNTVTLDTVYFLKGNEVTE